MFSCLIVMMWVIMWLMIWLLLFFSVQFRERKEKVEGEPGVPSGGRLNYALAPKESKLFEQYYKVGFVLLVLGRHLAVSVKRWKHKLLFLFKIWSGFWFVNFDPHIPLPTFLSPKIPLLPHKACLCTTLACLLSIFHIWPTTYPGWYPVCTHTNIREPQLRLLSSGCLELPYQTFTW